MKKDILVGDIILFKKNSKRYTVLEIKQKGYFGEKMFRVTSPDMVIPKVGMWVKRSEIMRCFQERDVKSL